MLRFFIVIRNGKKSFLWRWFFGCCKWSVFHCCSILHYINTIKNWSKNFIDVFFVRSKITCLQYYRFGTKKVQNAKFSAIAVKNYFNFLSISGYQPLHVKRSSKSWFAGNQLQEPLLRISSKINSTLLVLLWRVLENDTALVK